VAILPHQNLLLPDTIPDNDIRYPYKVMDFRICPDGSSPSEEDQRPDPDAVLRLLEEALDPMWVSDDPHAERCDHEYRKALDMPTLGFSTECTEAKMPQYRPSAAHGTKMQ